MATNLASILGGQQNRSPLLTQLLQRRPTPVSTPLGVVGSIGRGLLAGYLAREDRNQRNAAMQALAQGLGPQPAPMPSQPAGSGAGMIGGVTPAQLAAPTTTPGTLSTAMTALTGSGMQGNPYAVQYAAQLGLQQAANQQNLQNQLALARAKQKPAPPPGQFQGTGMVAQAYNVLLDPNADPSSPQYAAAWAELSRPQTQVDQVTGNLITTRRDLSRFTPPTGTAPTGAPQQQAALSPQQPAPGVTVQPMRKPKMSADESKSAGFADRMFEADRVLDDVAGEGSNLMGRMLEGVPLGNLGQEPEYQQFEQARRDFINAVLRRESGAVISDAEFANADRQYFPVPGDSPEVIAQKQRNRATALRGIARSAGQGYDAPWNIPKDELAELRKKLKAGTATPEELARIEIFARYQ